MDKLIIFWINRIMVWTVGRPFWEAVFSAVSRLDGRFDLDGDGKKSAIVEELTMFGYQFGKRQLNRAIENALIVLERKKA